MRHRRKPRLLHQKPDQADKILRNLATSLILYESVKTTKNRARAVQPFIEKLFSSVRGKDAQVAIRRLNRTLPDRLASRKVMEVLRERFADRRSGLTRITALGFRGGDGASLVRISFVESGTPKPSSSSPAAPPSAKRSKP